LEHLGRIAGKSRPWSWAAKKYKKINGLYEVRPQSNHKGEDCMSISLKRSGFGTGSVATFAGAAALAVSFAMPATAADFYKDKQVELTIGALRRATLLVIFPASLQSSHVTVLAPGRARHLIGFSLVPPKMAGCSALSILRH
jgi:hypothetical protein